VPRFQHGKIDPAKIDIVKSFMEATHGLISELTKNNDIRIYCHVADIDDGELYPVATVSSHRDSDYRVRIPFRGLKGKPFVLARAMETGEISAWNLESSHRDDYPEELKKKILANLRCVMAVPILAYEHADSDAQPIGTISLDCTSSTLQELGFADDSDVVVPEINDILKCCARAVYCVLTFTQLAHNEAAPTSD
jgi:hypothetical protein